ncbi:MAG TPA: hypothetical protein VML75_14190 [Kofleriaceae bacterium]|nr:hypothetical protein [Kofleriaceae bacterium]
MSKRWLGGMILVFVAVGMVLSYLMIRLLSDDVPDPLSKAERAELIQRATMEGPVLEHPTLGFSFRHPGAMFFPSREYEQHLKALARDESTRYYEYSELESGQILLVSVSKRNEQSGREFAEMVRNIEKLYQQKLSSRAPEGAPVETISAEVDGPRGTATIHDKIGASAHLRIGAWRKVVGDSGYVVLIIGVSPAGDAFGEVISSFRWDPK